MNRQFARLSELGQPNGQYTLGHIYVVTVERNGLADAHPGDRQQSDQGLIRQHAIGRL